MSARNLSSEELSILIQNAASEAAEKAADKAIEKLMLRLGVDIVEPDAIPKLKHNLKFLDERRQSYEDVRGLVRASSGRIIMAATGAAHIWAFYVRKGGVHDAAVDWLSAPK
jgi:hypothetical protein